MAVHMHSFDTDDDMKAFSDDLETILNRHLPLVSKSVMVAVMAQFIGYLGKSVDYEPAEFQALIDANICMGRDT